MASTSEYSTDSAIQTSMTAQRMTVHDLYGLVGVLTPNATEAQIRTSYAAMCKNLLPGEARSKAAKVAFSVLTNPTTRAQYDRDRLSYLYTQLKSHDLFPSNLEINENAREDQIAIYAAALKSHTCDPVEDKKARINTRLFQIRHELDDYKEKSKNVQEEWATSPNQILRMGANALREVELCARADIEVLENELGGLQGQLPPKNTDGTPGRMTSGHYGSEMGVQIKDRSLLAVNPGDPCIPRSPVVAKFLRSASKSGVRVGESSTGNSSSSTSRSNSTMPIGYRIHNYLVGSVYSPTFYAPATHLDAVQGQHGVERIIDRVKRQSLDPETLSDLASIKAENLSKPGEKVTVAGFDPVALPENNLAIREKWPLPAPSQPGDILQDDKTKNSHGLPNIGEISEHQENRSDVEAIDDKNGAAQMSTSSESSASTSSSKQSPPRLGLVEYQQRFGYHVITEDTQGEQKKDAVNSSKTSASARRRLPKPWISINDSVSMPVHLSSTRVDPHARAGVQPMSMENIDSPVDLPERFQRTRRSATTPTVAAHVNTAIATGGAGSNGTALGIQGAVIPDATPIGKLRTKPAFSSISNEILQQEFKAAQLKPGQRSRTFDRTTSIQSVQESVWEKVQIAPTATATQEFQDNSCKKLNVGNKFNVNDATPFEAVDFQGRDMAMQEPLERSVSRLQKEEAARTLIQLSRQGDKFSDAQQQGALNVGNAIQSKNTQTTVLQHTSGQQGGAQHGGPKYNASEYVGCVQQRWYEQMSNKHAQQYNSVKNSGAMFPMAPHIDPVVPTNYHRGIQEGYQTGCQIQQSRIEFAFPYGAIGSEMKAVKEMKAMKAQEEKKAENEEAVQEEKKTQQEKSTLDRAIKANKLARSLTVSHNGNDDPFVD
ncbi:hypothetical protein N0V82_005992 [Gnomoniopsis sp. IMI 355080]|nr:hypothetical protein N0V82_005992 [Gnomoniopsis sp. IMI 355080]